MRHPLQKVVCLKLIYACILQSSAHHLFDEMSLLAVDFRERERSFPEKCLKKRSLQPSKLIHQEIQILRWRKRRKENEDFMHMSYKLEVVQIIYL
ncbi:hypothetical protein K7X08_021483 [Anisodus acutangulus]|uniref:Uncharacterized protein n=1 Tax=Anisodus acutangulus TaxID=402998 RepID=A0A9Q1RBA7_9SOLA|nr:hypothetical protein K7X08_021483 [Anisodus acutangulus]